MTENPTRLRRMAAIASVCVAIILIIAKLWAWILSDSMALFSSLIDSTLDAFASLLTLIAVEHAGRPADKSHRFGHGKAEALSALAQAAFVLASALILIWQASRRLLYPEPAADEVGGIAVMVLSIVLTASLLLFQRWVVKQTQSVAIAADRMHYSGDLMMNLAVIAALLITSYTQHDFVDPVFAILIALIWLRGAWNIGRSAVDLLMDRELPRAVRGEIETVIRSVPGVVGMHDLRTHSTGSHIRIVAHIELEGDMNLHKAHSITDRVEMALSDAWPGADIILHQEPAGLVDERLDNIIAAGRTNG